MGEIADDMINGRCCSLCGQYFEDPKDPDIMFEHGYPVACDGCFDNNCGYQRATAPLIGDNISWDPDSGLKEPDDSNSKTNHNE